MHTTGISRAPGVLADARAVVAFDGVLLARSAGTALEIHDLRDPRQPRMLAAIDMPEIITDVALADGHATVTVVDHGVLRFDLRLPEHPGDAGWLHMRDLGDKASLVVARDRVFVGGGRSLDPRQEDIVGGWGLVVAEIDGPSPGASPSPTALSGVPSPTPTRASRSTPTPSAPPETPSPSPPHVICLPWLIRGIGGR
jgi:hypothetical protein